MPKKSSSSVIRLRGVRHNNLKNFDLDLPLRQLVVITGLSGSGKSSLAFDTLFAEGQRRYIETFSPYARQFFDRMDKPQVDSIEGIPPAIAIEQRNSVKSTRSTVGTMTEICDYMKLLWPQVAQLHCRQCGQPVRKDSPQQIWQTITSEVEKSSADSRSGATPSLPRSGGEGRGEEALIAQSRTLAIRNKTTPSPPLPRSFVAGEGEGLRGTVEMRPAEWLITFDIPVSEKISLDESLALISKQGYQRLLVEDEIVRLDEALPRLRESAPKSLTVIQDRVKPSAANRARFVEACEQAYHFGKGKLAIRELDADASSTQHATRNILLFSNRLHCARCDIEYREPTAALFSFNHPVGACPACRGFGRIITIDYDLALPDKSRTLAGGVVRPWQTGQSAECQDDLMKFCRIRNAPVNVPFEKLAKKWQDWVINGDADYGKDKAHEWPRAWYGVKGYFRWLESKSYKMHVRVLLSRYRSYVPCPDCGGKRFQPESLLYKVDSAKSADARPLSQPSAPLSPNGGEGEGLTVADFYQLPIRDALNFIEQLGAKQIRKSNDPLALVLSEVRSRLGYLCEVGLGYLTLDRSTRSLSGGETERVNLTTCLGSRLVNTLFVLDEPSVGLHPRDTSRLVRILERLRTAGNTVVVVEHEAGVMRAADQIIDLGPGHGAAGGSVVFQGSYPEILKSRDSLTGKYLSGATEIPLPKRRRVAPPTPKLKLSHAHAHNLRDIDLEIPLGRFVCVTGVSGSGKTTLVREVLLRLLNEKLKSQDSKTEKPDDPENPGTESENAKRQPAQLAGWESLGQVVLVDQSILGKTPRSNPAVYIGAFDDIREVFAQSETASLRGLGANAFSFNSAQGQCERCRGAGFEKIEMQFLSDIFIRCPECDGRRYRPHILDIKIAPPNSKLPERSIADILDATVDEAVEFLRAFADSRYAQRAANGLKLLQEVGLGYLRLGQPINTLSGGESQRLKLVRHLAESALADAPDAKPALFLFDEPTTGLHFDDVRVLLEVFQRLVNAGHSVIIVEHNMDVIKSADWVIDLGPDAGDEGGKVVAAGTPEEVAQCSASHTGNALRELVQRRP